MPHRADRQMLAPLLTLLSGFSAIPQFISLAAPELFLSDTDADLNIYRQVLLDLFTNS